MKIKSRQVTVYELHLECSCGKKDVFRIGEVKDEAEARERLPSFMWNGWNLKKEKCPSCECKGLIEESGDGES